MGAMYEFMTLSQDQPNTPHEMKTSFYTDKKFDKKYVKSSPERPRLSISRGSNDASGLFRKLSPKKKEQILNKMKSLKK